MKLSEVLKQEGITGSEEVSGDIDIVKLIKEIKELMELGQKYQGFKNPQQQPIHPIKTFEVPKQERMLKTNEETQTHPAQEKPKEETKETKHPSINKEKLKEEIKTILATYKDNPLAGSFSIKDGINYILTNDNYMNLASDMIIEAVKRSSE